MSSQLELDEDDDFRQAIEASLSDACGAAPQSASAHQELPDFITLHVVPPNGWCFYDCVSRHLRQGAMEGDESTIPAAAVADSELLGS